jgi:deuterolysin
MGFFTDGEVAFEGVRLYLGPQTDESAFQEIGAGESIEVTFDVAEVFDLSNGGDFDIQSVGSLQYAQGGDIKKLGSLSYESNKISTKVDGAAAAQALSIFQSLVKRATISSDCTGSRRTAVETAVKNTHDIAVDAAEQARTGPDSKMIEYFESADATTRSTVATAFDKMASAYATSGGKPDLHCRDVAGYCGRAVAYALPSSNTIVFCDPWFNNYQALNPACRAVDQAHISVHEATHLSMVKGTDDYGTYGYENSVALSARYNINHADTYAYFAHDTLSGC